jgi:iron complex outermembrane receptor protein
VVGKDFDESVLAVNDAYRLSEHFKLSAGIDNLLAKNYSEHLNLADSAGFADYRLDVTTRFNEPGRTWCMGRYALLIHRVEGGGKLPAPTDD